MMDVTECQEDVKGAYMKRRTFLENCSCFGITSIAYSSGLLAWPTSGKTTWATASLL